MLATNPDALIVTLYLMAAAFFVVALIYSSVGMGGGSSYTALMAIFGINILAVPLISLVLNLMVTSVGSYNFIRNKHGRFRLILPFLFSSIPMAYLGGSLEIPAQLFYWVLLISLIFVATRIYLWKSVSISLNLSSKEKLIISMIAGSVLGLIAGIVGIGGGIYLVPLIIILGLGSEKEAAACGAIFIWLNSLSGLASRIQFNQISIIEYWPLIPAVLVGGMIGSYMGSFRFSSKKIDQILGLVVVVASVLLIKKIIL